MTKREMQNLRVEQVAELGQKFPIFLDYDGEEYVRNAIFDWNFLKHPDAPLSDKIIKEILERIDGESKTKEEEMIFVINNPRSRRRGLHAILGKDLFRIINKYNNLFGTLMVFAKDVRICYKDIA